MNERFWAVSESGEKGSFCIRGRCHKSFVDNSFRKDDSSKRAKTSTLKTCIRKDLVTEASWPREHSAKISFPAAKTLQARQVGLGGGEEAAGEKPPNDQIPSKALQKSLRKRGLVPVNQVLAHKLGTGPLFARVSEKSGGNWTNE
jgi:hypothetical protein